MSADFFPSTMPAGRSPVYFFCRNYFPTITGVTERFRRYLQGLAELGIDFYIVTSLTDLSLPAVEKLQRESVRRLPVVDGQFVNTETLLLPMLPELERAAPGVIQIYEVTPGMRAPLRRLQELGHRILLVRTIMPTFEPPRLSLRGIKCILNAWLDSRSIDQMTAGSSVMRDAFSLGLKSLNSKFAIIPHGVNLDRFKPVVDADTKASVRERLGLRKNDLIILSVGSVMERKRTHLIVDTFKAINQSVPDSQLVIIGENKTRDTLSAKKHRDSFQAYSEQVSKSAAECSQGSVIFTGEVTRVEDYYQAADIFLFTSTIEGMPNAVIEAMASGLPCVLTPFKGLPETEFGHGGQEFVLSGATAREMQNHVTELIANTEKRHKLGAAARRFAEARLSSKDAIRAYANIYVTNPTT